MPEINFYLIVNEIHSFFAFIFLLSCIISIGYAIVGLINKNKFTNTQFRLAQITTMVGHLQLLLGLLLWYLAGYLPMLINGNTAEIMTNPALRKIAVEHPMANILGIILLTIGYSLMKRQTRGAIKRNMFVLVFYGLAFILITSRIPWHLWAGH